MKSVQASLTPLSTVLTDAKYSLKINSALALSSVTILPSLSSSAQIPDCQVVHLDT